MLGRFCKVYKKRFLAHGPRMMRKPWNLKTNELEECLKEYTAQITCGLVEKLINLFALKEKKKFSW